MQGNYMNEKYTDQNNIMMKQRSIIYVDNEYISYLK